MEPQFSIDEVRSAGRRLAGPFRLGVRHEGRLEIIRCEQVLRVLPGKRIVCSTTWRNEPAIAKIFLNRWRPDARARRELDGLLALEQAGIPAPRLLANCRSDDGRRPILLFERITPAEDFGKRLGHCAGVRARQELLAQAVELIARQHEAGIYQQDPHVENFLVQDGVLYAIDGGTVRTAVETKPLELSTGLKNLGHFLAELPPSDDELLPALCQTYVRARQRPVPADVADRLSRFVRAFRARRLRIILRKTKRDCTDFVRYAGNGYHVICRRDYDSPEMRRLLTAADKAIADGFALKQGNSATAAKVEVNGRPLVIKRYNLNHFRKILRDVLLPGRAHRAWKNAHVLDALGIATAKPMALVERRKGLLKTATYFVTEFVSGEQGRQLFGRAKLTDQESRDIATATISSLARLHTAGLSHGDLKATNLMYRGGELVLIDVDAVRQHRFGWLARRRQRRDLRRLLRNFTESSALYRRITSRIARHDDNVSGSPAGGPFQNVIRRGGLKVWHRIDSPLPLTSESLLDCLEHSAAPGLPKTDVLTVYRHRSMVSLESGDFPFVVKAFPLERLRDQLRWKNYAPAEFKNYLRASGLGIPTPVYYGLFRFRRRGLVKNCGVVMEKLCDHTDLARLSEQDKSQILRAVPVLADLYLRGVDHLNVKPSNVFFHNRTGRPVIIDWQHCRFHSLRNDVQLVMQGAQFLNFADVAPHGTLWIEWVAELHRQSGTGMSLGELRSEIEHRQAEKLRVADRLRVSERLFKAA